VPQWVGVRALEAALMLGRNPYNSRMKLYAADAEISSLEGVLTDPRGEGLLAATVALAWHLRQRDSARALRLVGGVMPALGGAPEAHDVEVVAPVAHRARAALAACEATALFCDFEAAERWLADARQHIDPQSDAQAEGDACLVESVLAKARGQRVRELAALDHAIGFFENSGAPERLAIARMWASFERAFDQHDLETSAGLEPPGKAWPEASIAWDALWSAARALALSHRDPATAASVYQHASRQARLVGMVRLEVVAMINAGAAIQGLGDYDVAADCFDVAATRARATGWPTLIGATNTRIGELLRNLGAFEESRTILSEAIQALSVGSRGVNLAIACAALAQTLQAMGLAVESLEPMGEAIAMYRESKSSPNLALNLIFQARGLAAAGQPERTIAVLDEAQSLIDAWGLNSLQVGITDVLADLHHRFPLPAPAGMTLPNGALHYGEATLREGLRIEGWKAPGVLYAFLAECWAEVGEHARAYDYARQALKAKEQETAQKMNYPLALVRLRRRGGRDGDAGSGAAIAPASAPGGDDDRQRRQATKTLTPKERSILLLLARNYSNKEIAKSIDVSDETVKWHLKNLFNKLDAGSRKHAVTRARTLGFISFSA
jgi:DNA-binding CsgD family transcriptional regulator/N-acetylglutamate synthase-like GNAT family acetyltransferase